jgi:hypothetical protein
LSHRFPPASNPGLGIKSLINTFCAVADDTRRTA